MERLYNRPTGRGAPERRSMAQSYRQWGGSESALSLLKTGAKSWYAGGIPVRTGGESAGLAPLGGEEAERRQLAWQAMLQPRIRPVDQETWGSCLSNQGRPNTSGAVGACKTKNWMVSTWLPERVRDRGAVQCVILPREWPSSTCADRAASIGSRGIPAWWARVTSIRHSSAPESNSAPTESDSRPQATEAGNNLLTSDEGEWVSVRLTRTPPPSEPGLLAEWDSPE